MFFKAHFLCFLTALLPIYVQGNSGQCSLPGLVSRIPQGSPINIITSLAIPVNVTTPITTVSELLHLKTVINRGYIVDVVTTNEATDSSYITGGVLCDNKYRFHDSQIYINQFFGRSNSLINGIGAPVEVVSMYYHEKYNSFKKAIGKPGAIVQVSNLVTVGFIPNPFFIPFQILLKSGAIKKPGSTVTTLGTVALGWAYNSVPTNAYYAFHGSYVNRSAGQHYFGTGILNGKAYPGTIILVPTSMQSISIGQFFSLRNILGTNGKPIQAVSAIYPQGLRPVYKAFGFVNTFKLF